MLQYKNRKEWQSVECSLAIYYLLGIDTNIDILKEEEEYTSSNINLTKSSIVLGNHYEEPFIEGCPEFDINYDGLVSTHAYAFIEYDKIKGLIYLANPWGCYEPGTDATVFDGLNNSRDNYNDGVFAMPVDEFIKKRTWTVYNIVQKPASN